MQKIIKDVFVDYQKNNSITNSEIIDTSLFKKTNRIQMNIMAFSQISIDEIEDFENYLIKRFNIGRALINIKYDSVDINQSIEEDFPKIIQYITKKEPFSKAILTNSKAEVSGNELVVRLSIKGTDFLCQKKFDKGLEHILMNLYNKQYSVKFVDDVGDDYLKRFAEKQQMQEKEEFDRLQKEQKETKRTEEQKEYLNGNAWGSESSINQDSYTEINQPDWVINGVANVKKESDLFEHATKDELDQANQDAQIEAEIMSADEAKPELPTNKEDAPEESPLIYGRSTILKGIPTRIKDINVETSNVILDGEMIKGTLDGKEIKNGEKIIMMFNLYDGTSSITCKAFLNSDQYGSISKKISGAKGLRIDGVAKYDNFSKEVTVMINTIIETKGKEKFERKDEAPRKRVELHMHTQMSALDAVTPCEDLVKRAMSWGWNSIAITDHGVVQSFPEAHKYLEKAGGDFKVLYGVEGYFVPDKDPAVFNSNGQSIDTTYCILDLETTGISYITEKITEVGIVKIKDGKQIDSFECFVNPEKPIPQEVVDITHITDEMVKDAETIDKVIPKIIDFIGDSVLVAHNADFDISYLKYNFEKYGYKLENSYIDTLRLSKAVFPDLKRFKLGLIAEYLGIEVEVAHRALDDVITLHKVFNHIVERTKDLDGTTIDDFDNKFERDYTKLPSYHIIIIAKNYVGLRNLYKLVSISHLDYFYKKPRILKSILNKYREGLIIGSACEAGELYRAIIAKRTDEEIEEIASYYDYLEVQPIGNNEYLIRDGQVESKEDLKDNIRKIVELGKKINKPVCATCDVHFMDPQDEIYRRILQAGQKYDDADMQAPLYLRTTEEMLKEFDFLGDEVAEKIVIDNTNLVASWCENIKPISPEKCPPHIPGCEQTIKDIAYSKAYELYGDPLPDIVKERLDKELDSIINNGFSVMYIIAQKLVWKSNEDGYLVGSRGSVGSSFVAYMTGITEVNSLKAHYRCPKCKYSDFSDYGIANGFDLPDKKCPKCGEMLDKDGMDIPFETFLGFNGDKEPDIDLNFSGEYQAKAHKYTEVIFGKGTTFKAGTVGTIADKTAYGYVKGYYTDRNIPISSAEIARISVGCTGIKRTTGQHPGGIIVVPKGREIYEFTPVQHPADDPNSDIITTHFDYHSIDANLLKLDILGHDDPTIIRMLQDITGIDPHQIPLDDKDTMKLFSSTESLDVTPEQLNGSPVGSFGVPEFGTKFVRGMLVDTKPHTFDELIRISGLSHGTDVWLNNAQLLVQDNIVTLKEAICCRDDIMIYLIQKGLPKDTSFKIMESVRKGKVAKGKDDKWPQYVELMKEHDVPDWYMDSCKKIKYMFPKAHAAAYVTMAFRIAWFKVHIPKAYYAAYFSIRAKQLDSDAMFHGVQKVRAKMKEIDDAGNAAQNKDKEMYPVLELALEFYERGFKFLPADLYKSHDSNFIVEDEGLRIPFSAINGLGPIDAENLYNAAQEELNNDEEFMCIDEIQSKAKIGKVSMDILREIGLFAGMSESNQLSLFG